MINKIDVGNEERDNNEGRNNKGRNDEGKTNQICKQEKLADQTEFGFLNKWPNKQRAISVPTRIIINEGHYPNRTHLSVSFCPPYQISGEISDMISSQ